MIWQLSTAGTLEIIDGIDLQSFEALGGPFQLFGGWPVSGSGRRVWWTTILRRQKHVKVGDTIEILNHNFRMCGIVEHGRGARKFLPIATLQDLIGAKDKASVFYVKLDDPANADAVVKEVKSQPGMEKYAVRSIAEYLSHDDAQPSAGIPTIHRCGDWGQP